MTGYAGAAPLEYSDLVPLVYCHYFLADRLEIAILTAMWDPQRRNRRGDHGWSSSLQDGFLMLFRTGLGGNSRQSRRIKQYFERGEVFEILGFNDNR